MRWDDSLLPSLVCLPDDKKNVVFKGSLVCLVIMCTFSAALVMNVSHLLPRVMRIHIGIADIFRLNIVSIGCTVVSSSTGKALVKVALEHACNWWNNHQDRVTECFMPERFMPLCIKIKTSKHDLAMLFLYKKWWTLKHPIQCD